jgi:hypothetical protein
MTYDISVFGPNIFFSSLPTHHLLFSGHVRGVPMGPLVSWFWEHQQTGPVGLEAFDTISIRRFDLVL